MEQLEWGEGSLRNRFRDGEVKTVNEEVNFGIPVTGAIANNAESEVKAALFSVSRGMVRGDRGNLVTRTVPLDKFKVSEGLAIASRISTAAGGGPRLLGRRKGCMMRREEIG